MLTIDDPDYPSLLKRIPDPPVALWLVGDPMLLWQPQLAVVGSRNPTRGGLENATAFAAYLSQQGLLMTSGLADGIDAAVHKAALKQAATIAVLGTGVDVIYPACNRALAAQIATQGLLVSEFPPGTEARPSHFPSRNRIISGLSLGTLVVEAGYRSGSLITARLASEQGREIFAIPGSIHNPMARGCHRLIRDGAKLVETGKDVLQELTSVAAELAAELRQRLIEEEGGGEDKGEAWAEGRGQTLFAETSTPISADNKRNFEVSGMPDDPEYRQLWDCLSYDPQHMDKISSACGLTPQAVSSMLLMLELRGLVETYPGGAFSRKA
ncbi:MAG: DNA-processing protein DprA [Xanthomonadales bacterium]|nr:DNA-processing protein DprA [Xanthomonadales bacterium]